MRLLWRWRHRRRCQNWLRFDDFSVSSTTPCCFGAMITALRGKKLIAVRPSNPFPETHRGSIRCFSNPFPVTGTSPPQSTRVYPFAAHASRANLIFPAEPRLVRFAGRQPSSPVTRPWSRQSPPLIGRCWWRHDENPDRCWCWWSSPPESNHSPQQQWHTTIPMLLSSSASASVKRR